MSKTVRPWDVDPSQPPPPAVLAFVPEGRVSHIVRNLAREARDLSAILAPRRDRNATINIVLYPPPAIASTHRRRASRSSGITGMMAL
jgi:hypothetical protein